MLTLNTFLFTKLLWEEHVEGAFAYKVVFTEILAFLKLISLITNSAANYTTWKQLLKQNDS